MRPGEVWERAAPGDHGTRAVTWWLVVEATTPDAPVVLERLDGDLRAIGAPLMRLPAQPGRHWQKMHDAPAIAG